MRDWSYVTKTPVPSGVSFVTITSVPTFEICESACSLLRVRRLRCGLDEL